MTTRRRARVGAPMDALLTDSGPGGIGRFVPGKPILKAAARLTTRPDRVAKRLGTTRGRESARVWAGRSEIEPPKGDRRFKDDAWRGNPAFRRLSQLYLLWAREVDGLIDDADLDWQDERRLRFAADNVVGALAPTNFPAGNPAVLKATLDNGGTNLTSGAKKFVKDMAKSPRIPNMVDTSEFEIGENIAVTPGAVVLRTDVFELIQYEPRTSQVREVPLLVVPPMINKYYVTDLAAGPQHGPAPARRRASRCSASRGATPARTRPTGAWTPTRPRWSRRWTPPSPSPPRTPRTCWACAPAAS